MSKSHALVAVHPIQYTNNVDVLATKLFDHRPSLQEVTEFDKQLQGLNRPYVLITATPVFARQLKIDNDRRSTVMLERPHPQPNQNEERSPANDC